MYACIQPQVTHILASPCLPYLPCLQSLFRRANVSFRAAYIQKAMINSNCSKTHSSRGPQLALSTRQEVYHQCPHCICWDTRRCVCHFFVSRNEFCHFFCMYTFTLLVDVGILGQCSLTCKCRIHGAGDSGCKGIMYVRLCRHMTLAQACMHTCMHVCIRDGRTCLVRAARVPSPSSVAALFHLHAPQDSPTAPPG
jgi:hypothetical protein